MSVHFERHDMKITWVEKLAKTGLISDKVKLDIYTDVQKLANEEESAAEAAFHKYIGGPAILGGLFWAGGKALQPFLDKHEAKKLEASRNSLGERYNKQDLQKAQARFDEVIRISPSLAKHPDKMDSLIKSRLNTGLTSDDMLKLVPVEVALKQEPFKGQEKRAGHNPNFAKLAGEYCADSIALLTDRVGVDYMRSAVDEGFSKEAKGTQVFSQNVKNLLALGSMSLLMGAGAGAAQSLAATIKNRKLSNQIKDSFNKAMEMDKKDPDGGHLSQDKAKALQAFKTLTHFAPQVAAEPMAAKTFMKKMVQMNDLQSSDVKDLTDIRRNIMQSTEGSPFMHGFASGVDVGGLRGMLTTPIKDDKSPMQAVGLELAGAGA
jgi:hypothetical protein